MKVLIVIDMQNDFITGSLANPNAVDIVKPICNYIKGWDGDLILCTRDTHLKSYLNSYEGKHLSIEHCIQYTDGWRVDSNIIKAIKEWIIKDKKHYGCMLNKPYFGYAETISNKIFDVMDILFEDGTKEKVESIEFVGTVTEICVVSNVLGLKPYFPETDFIVHSDMCAGLTSDGHEAALKVMQACQVEIKNKRS